MNKRIYDISMPVFTGMVLWPGDPPLEITQEMKLGDGDTANVSCLNMGVHTGTHIDAPLHFFDGREAVDRIGLETLIGPAVLWPIAQERDIIEVQDLAEIPFNPWPQRVLFKTRNSDFWAEKGKAFQSDYCALSPAAARFLVQKRVKLVGIDYLSIAPYEDAATVHRILLDAGVVIIEGLNLAEIPAGDYELICLPLKLMGIEGAPARVILREL